jgi:hypothetical protein
MPTAAANPALARDLGQPTFLTAGECASAMAATEGQARRAWDHWRMRVEGEK